MYPNAVEINLFVQSIDQHGNVTSSGDVEHCPNRVPLIELFAANPNTRKITLTNLDNTTAEYVRL